VIAPAGTAGSRLVLRRFFAPALVTHARKKNDVGGGARTALVIQRSETKRRLPEFQNTGHRVCSPSRCFAVFASPPTVRVRGLSRSGASQSGRRHALPLLQHYEFAAALVNGRLIQILWEATRGRAWLGGLTSRTTNLRGRARRRALLPLRSRDRDRCALRALGRRRHPGRGGSRL
jgi:hypothetical protein